MKTPFEKKKKRKHLDFSNIMPFFPLPLFSPIPFIHPIHQSKTLYPDLVRVHDLYQDHRVHHHDHHPGHRAPPPCVPCSWAWAGRRQAGYPGANCREGCSSGSWNRGCWWCLGRWGRDPWGSFWRRGGRCSSVERRRWWCRGGLCLFGFFILVRSRSSSCVVKRCVKRVDFNDW